MVDSGYLPHLQLPFNKQPVLTFEEAVDIYQKFWFTNIYDIITVLEQNNSGVIALQNSWTPSYFKNGMNCEEFLKTDVLFSRLVKNILGK